VSGRLRVVVVDDHPVFRAGLAAFLQDDVADVVGEAGSGEEAVDAVAATAPDVVLMDLHMPGLGGVEATRRIAATHPGVAVLVLTMLDDDTSLVAALRAGARGYLLKEAAPDEIRRAVEAVAAGDAVFHAGVADRVLATVAQRPLQAPALADLTERERAVLDLVAVGLTNTEIARRLYLSEKTVRNYVSTVFAKLGVTDRAAAVARARDAGLGKG
jgi:DNA-binding NarL/FixJ family response regulator